MTAAVVPIATNDVAVESEIRRLGWEGRVFVHVSDVRRAAGVSERTVRAWVAAGSIPWRRLGGRVVFHVPELVRWMLERPAGPPDDAVSATG